MKNGSKDIGKFWLKRKEKHVASFYTLLWRILTWYLNNWKTGWIVKPGKKITKEGIETTFKTHLSSASGGKYYRFDDFI